MEEHFVFFLLGDSPVSEFYALMFRNILYVPSSWEVSAGRLNGTRCKCIYTAKGLTHNFLSQTEGGGMRRGGMSLYRNRLWGADPKWRAVVSMSRRNCLMLEWGRGAMGW
jgi:hypothetical protein